MTWKICSWFLVRILNCLGKRKEIVSENEGNKILENFTVSASRHFKSRDNSFWSRTTQRKSKEAKDRIDKFKIPSLFLSWEKKCMIISICGNCIFGQWEAGSFLWSVHHKAAAQTSHHFPSIAQNVVRKYCVVVFHKLGPRKINLLLFKISVWGGEGLQILGLFYLIYKISPKLAPQGK